MASLSPRVTNQGAGQGVFPVATETASISSAVGAIAISNSQGSGGADLASRISIYQPCVELTPELIAAHANDIAAIKAKKGVIGIGAVQHKKTGEIKLVYIKFERKKVNCDVYRFVLYTMDGSPFGYGDVRPYLNRGDTFGNLDDLFTDFLEESYGTEEKRVNKGKLEELQNLTYGTWRNVGFLLVKAGLQHYLKQGCEARMDVLAGKTSHIFYYKLGFRALDAATNARIEKAMAEKRGTADLMSVRMFLPREAREQWLKGIAEDPLRLPE